MNQRLKFLFFSLIFSLFFWLGVNVLQENLENFFSAQISKPYQEIVLVNPKLKSENSKLELNVKSAISLKINESGKKRVLFKKEINEILPIASLTKLMTALIVIEDPENYNFEKVVVISGGEKKTVKELLESLLIFSDNSAAESLAGVIGEDFFVEKMNQKSQILGLENTHLVNPTGLDPENITFLEESKNYFNYSTARDLARLSEYILNEFPLIFEISVSQRNFQIENIWQDLNIVGLKTGYTKEAGGCMILILEKEGSYFINVILGTDSKESRISEMQKLINFIQK